MNELFLPSGTHKEEKTASSLLVAALCDENLIGYRIACLSLDRANPKPVSTRTSWVVLINLKVTISAATWLAV